MRSQGLQKHEFQVSFDLVAYRKTTCTHSGNVSCIQGQYRESMSDKGRHTIQSPGTKCLRFCGGSV